MEYVGFDAPRWVREGVQLRVKRLPWTRDGWRIGGWTRSHTERGDYVHPGDVGTIRRREGNGWWDWVVEFAHGGHKTLDKESLENLARVATKKVGT